MHFHTFHREQLETLERFFLWWREQHKQNPDKFPAELEPGEWYEQLMMFEG